MNMGWLLVAPISLPINPYVIRFIWNMWYTANDEWTWWMDIFITCEEIIYTSILFKYSWCVMQIYFQQGIQSYTCTRYSITHVRTEDLALRLWHDPVSGANTSMVWCSVSLSTMVYNFVIRSHMWVRVRVRRAERGDARGLWSDTNWL